MLGNKETSGRTEELSIINADVSRLETEYNEVLATINNRYPAYAKITQPVSWTLRRIQEEVIVNDQTMLLEYSLGREKSYAWTVTRNGMKVFELPGQEAITSAARKLSDVLKLPPLGDSENKLTQASQELSQMVLAPLAAELDKQVIIVAADGALNYIPFQILPSPSTNEPLVTRFEIINSPSASILGDLRKEAAQRQPAPKLLAAFGDPTFRSTHVASNSTEQMLSMQRWRSASRDITPNRDSFDPSMIPPLFFAAQELANLRELAGEEALVLTDISATRESLLKTDLAQFAVLHFATHGYFDPGRPENSGLLLSTTNSQGELIDGFVGLHDIYELRAPLLVVMSACETALGRDVQGEGLVGLTRGFMYAGASSVVATLWKVDDAATAELMKLFYSNMLQGGMNPGEALRTAQNSIRQTPEWRSPYYWAAFVLQGEYRQVIKPPARAQGLASRWKAGIAITLVIVLTGIVALYVRRRTRTA
jgi:CHAT domain-containing protein